MHVANLHVIQLYFTDIKVAIQQRSQSCRSSKVAQLLETGENSDSSGIERERSRFHRGAGKTPSDVVHKNDGATCGQRHVHVENFHPDDHGAIAYSTIVFNRYNFIVLYKIINFFFLEELMCFN